jgi:hypothetical protein
VPWIALDPTQWAPKTVAASSNETACFARSSSSSRCVARHPRCRSV